MTKDKKYPRIALIGQPNSGKSTLFNILSDIKSETSNFAGTTDNVELSDINIAGRVFTLADLPGIYSLNPTTDQEKTTYDFIVENKPDLIINVVDSSLLARSLELTVELMELGLPMVIALNMLDEAENQGNDIDIEKLKDLLNLPVVPTMAKFGKGAKELTDACFKQFLSSDSSPKGLSYTHHVENRINQLIEMIEPNSRDLIGGARFYAIKSIENPSLVPKDILQTIEPLKEEIQKEALQMHRMDSFETISYERHHLAMKISEQISRFRDTRHQGFLDKFDNQLLHPIFGHFYLLVYFFIYFLIIFIVGDLISSVVEQPIADLALVFEPLRESSPFLWFTINGAYMGISGILGVVLPYFLPLVLLTSLFEETGYMSRIAFLVDSFMHKIGLHGKSVVPFVLGFGCSVPAVYATRMIESKRDRTITAVLLPFIPCSARIAVIFALTAAFLNPFAAIAVFLFVIFIIAIVGKLMSRFISRPTGMIMEITALRKPSMKISFRKTWLKIRDFLKEAFTFLMLGSIVLGWVEYFNAAHYLNMFFQPVLESVLGLPENLGSTLLFGFFRKELILVMATQAMHVQTLAQLPLTPDQVFVFIIFVTLYFPCFTTFVVIFKEFGTRVAMISAVLSFVLATISAFLFRIILAL